MAIYLLVTNLMSRQQIKSSLPEFEFQYIKSLNDLTETDASLIVELNDRTMNELRENISLVESKISKVLCFYPHQQTSLAQEAIKLGLKNLCVKSKFFNEMKNLVSEL